MSWSELLHLLGVARTRIRLCPESGHDLSALIPHEMIAEFDRLKRSLELPYPPIFLSGDMPSDLEGEVGIGWSSPCGLSGGTWYIRGTTDGRKNHRVFPIDFVNDPGLSALAPALEAWANHAARKDNSPAKELWNRIDAERIGGPQEHWKALETVLVQLLTSRFAHADQYSDLLSLVHVPILNKIAELSEVADIYPPPLMLQGDHHPQADFRQSLRASWPPSTEREGMAYEYRSRKNGFGEEGELTADRWKLLREVVSAWIDELRIWCLGVDIPAASNLPASFSGWGSFNPYAIAARFGSTITPSFGTNQDSDQHKPFMATARTSESGAADLDRRARANGAGIYSGGSGGSPPMGPNAMLEGSNPQTAPGQELTSPDDPYNSHEWEKLKPSQKLAFWSYQQARLMAENPDLEDDPAWELLNEQGIEKPDRTSYSLPCCATWKRYLRAARKAIGERKHNPRRRP